MRLDFDSRLVDTYKSPSQKARVLTESWVEREVYCPNCGSTLSAYQNNRPVADFYCKPCKEVFELKSKRNTFGKKIIDGAYSTMIERLESQQNPSFFLLNYDPASFRVIDFAVVPKHFFTPEIIEKRKPLSQKARRAGWTGCNILLQTIPQAGRIYYIRGSRCVSKSTVIANWQKTLFLRETRSSELKGWVLDVLICIDKMKKREFLLENMYIFEKELSLKHPSNRHVRDKIRQQLQVLRDKGFLEFLGRGKYRLLN